MSVQMMTVMQGSVSSAELEVIGQHVEAQAFPVHSGRGRWQRYALSLTDPSTEELIHRILSGMRSRRVA